MLAGKNPFNTSIILLYLMIVLIPDVNECILGTNNCSQFCTNTIGSYLCGCNTGYTLGADNITCNGKASIIYIS